jgi:two-component system chemotaxis sensor kinase CheA
MPLNQEDQQKYKALYLQTARQITSEIKESLAKLSSGNDTQEIIEVLHRAFHSLKGQSEMMEYQALGSLSRLLEFTFAAVRESKLTLSEDIVQKIHEAVAEIETCFNELEKNNKESDLSQITKSLQSLTKIQL